MPSPPDKLVEQGPLRLVFSWLNRLRAWTISLRLKQGPGFKLSYDTDGIAMTPDFRSVLASAAGTKFRGEWNPWGNKPGATVTDVNGEPPGYKKGDIVVRGSRDPSQSQFWSMPQELLVTHPTDDYWAAGDVCGTYVCIKDTPPCKIIDGAGPLEYHWEMGPEPKQPNDTEPGSLYWATLATAAFIRLVIKGANGTTIDLDPSLTLDEGIEIVPRQFTFSDQGVQKTMWIMASEPRDV